MILRRFTQHLKEQNWFAVWLDVLVVIVGIFLGMQVTEWNEQRKQEQVELLYVQRLHNDITKQIRENTNRNLYVTSLKENNKLIVDWLNSKTLVHVEPERIVSAFLISSIIYPYELHSVTFDELINTGNIGLIQDVKLRQLVAEFYSETRANMPFWSLSRDNAFRMTVRSIIPTDLQDEIFDYCSGEDNERWIIKENCQVKMDTKLTQTILERLREAPDIHKISRFNLSILTDGLGLDLGNIDKAKEVERKLSETLSKRRQ